MTDPSQALRLVEALLFASPTPLTEAAIAERLPDGADVPELIDALAAHYQGRGVTLMPVAGGWAFRTALDLAPLIRDAGHVVRRMSRAALETLAIIAYRQPMTAPEIQELRGVSAAGVLKTLLERRLVRIVGRKEVVGKPFLYGTTREFLVHFGLNALKDLPPLEDFEETFGSGDASAVAGLAEMAGLPPRLDEVEPRGEDREERILREIADLEERQEDELP